MANDDPNILTLQYSSSTALTSMLIRRVTDSPFSHVDMVLTGEGLLGASGGPDTYKLTGGVAYHDPGGVQIRPWEPWNYEIKKTIRVRTPRAEAIRARWRTQINKPFDDSALFAMLSGKAGERDWRSQDKWFCSEGVIWSAEFEGCFPWDLVVAKNRVTPPDSLLSFNPFIFPEDIAMLRAMLSETNGAT